MSKLMKILRSASNDEKTYDYFYDLHMKASNLANTRMKRNEEYDPSLYNDYLEEELQKLLRMEMRNSDFCVVSIQEMMMRLETLSRQLPFYRSITDVFGKIRDQFNEQGRDEMISQKKIDRFSSICSKYEDHLNEVILSYGSNKTSQGYVIAEEKLAAIQDCQAVLNPLTINPEGANSDLCQEFQTEFESKVGTFSKKRDISDYKFINAIRDCFSYVAGLVSGKNSLWNKSEGGKVVVEVKKLLVEEEDRDTPKI